MTLGPSVRREKDIFSRAEDIQKEGRVRLMGAGWGHELGGGGLQCREHEGLLDRYIAATAWNGGERGGGGREREGEQS